MSETYTDLVYTQFPDSIDTFTYMQDISQEKISAINAYNTYINDGDFSSAVAMLAADATLATMIFNAEKINKLIDAIKANQRLFSDDIENYIENYTVALGNYSAIRQYSKGNIVYYNSIPYMCDGTVSGGVTISPDIPYGTLPTNTQYWHPLAIKGDQGATGLGLTPRGVWDVSTTYYQYDMVAYNNALWQCESRVTGFSPSAESTHWSLLLTFDASMLTFNNSDTNLTSTSMREAIIEVNDKVDNMMVPYSDQTILGSSDTILAWGIGLSCENHAMTLDSSGYPADSPRNSEGYIECKFVNSLRRTVIFVTYISGTCQIYMRHTYNTGWSEDSWIEVTDVVRALGYTPVQQGGGNGQAANKVYLGWTSNASGLKVQVDSSDLGYLLTYTDAANARSKLGLSYGSTAGSVCQGNDARLSDARTPVGHNHGAGNITTGTFGGNVSVPASASFTSAIVHNAVILPKANAPTVGANSIYPVGTIIFTYK